MTSKNAINTPAQETLENYGELKDSVELMLSIVQRMIKVEEAKLTKPKTKTRKAKTKKSTIKTDSKLDESISKSKLVEKTAMTINIGKALNGKKDCMITGKGLELKGIQGLNVVIHKGETKALIINSGRDNWSYETTKAWVGENVLPKFEGYEFGGSMTGMYSFPVSPLSLLSNNEVLQS